MTTSNQVASTQTQNIVPVQAAFNTAGQCLGLVGPGGAYFSPPLTADVITGATIDNSPLGATTPSTVNATNVSVNGKLHISATAPTIASGFGTSPTITAFNTSAFKVVVGTGGAASGTITFPAAPNGWFVYAQDVTSGTTIFLQQTASSTTSATVTSFSITTGLAANMSAGDTILLMALAY
jgi:hypothetical protein